MSTPLHLRIRQRIGSALLLAALGAVWIMPTSAVAAGAIAQGFTTSDNTVTGSVIDLKSDSENVAELATSARADQLLGVVGNKSLIELGGGSKQIQVVTSGLTTVLVSDINGSVKTGDKITASPLAGIGMKATQSTTVVGIAQANLDASTATNRTVTALDGKSTDVHIGSIPLQVNVTFYSAKEDKLSPLVPSFLQTLSNSIAGHNVAALRVFIGFFALLAGFLTISVILYAAIHSDIISIGRNPLAQGALRRGLFQVVLTALGILLLTVMVTYIVLSA